MEELRNGLVEQKLTAEQKRCDLQKDLEELQRRPVMGAMAVLPPGVEFETKDQEEQVILVLRRHFVTNLYWIIGSISLLALVWLAWVAGFFPGNLSTRYQFLVVLLWTLFVAGYALEQFLIWFFNVYVVTNERIVDIDFHNLLYREISDADLDKVQDVTIKGAGVMAAVFHYGDILIQTAAESQMFEFLAVPQPELVSKVIRELIEYSELYKEQKGEKR